MTNLRPKLFEVIKIYSEVQEYYFNESKHERDNNDVNLNKKNKKLKYSKEKFCDRFI